MAEKTISFSDIKKLEADGSELELDPDVTQIERFDELIDAMNKMIANESERVRADLARNQTNLEILATLQALIRKQTNMKPAPIDLAPLQTALAQIQEVSTERVKVGYEFDFQFNSQGRYSKVIARPLAPTTH